MSSPFKGAGAQGSPEAEELPEEAPEEATEGAEVGVIASPGDSDSPRVTPPQPQKPPPFPHPLEPGGTGFLGKNHQPPLPRTPSPALGVPDASFPRTPPLVGARLQGFWNRWLQEGADPWIVSVLREGYKLEFEDLPNLTTQPIWNLNSNHPQI